MTAPVCPGQTTAPDSAFGTGATRFPSIPLAYDLQSALSAISALRQAMQLLAQQIQQQQKPPARPASGAGSGGSGAKSQPTKAKPNWKETNRTTKRERVENPDDASQFVDVELITSLTMTNQSTGETWTWRR